MKNELLYITSPDTWIELRVLYESGEFRNLSEMYEKVKDRFPDMPIRGLLGERCAEECWDRERFSEMKVEVKHRNMLELYENLGMGEEEQARYRVEAVRAVDNIRLVINDLYGLLKGLDPLSSQYTQTLSKIKVLSDTMFKGLNTSLTTLQDISKLSGNYQTAENEKKSRRDIEEIEDMSEEEIIQDLKRMRAAGININEIEDLNSSSDERKQGNAA